MVDIYTYIVPLPDGINEAVMACASGCTVYIDDRLSPEGRIKAYNHAIRHIQSNDFEKTDVQEIEAKTHAL
jgi:hypothetical protein